MKKGWIVALVVIVVVVVLVFVLKGKGGPEGTKKGGDAAVAAEAVPEEGLEAIRTGETEEAAQIRESMREAGEDVD